MAVAKVEADGGKIQRLDEDAPLPPRDRDGPPRPHRGAPPGGRPFAKGKPSKPFRERTEAPAPAPWSPPIEGPRTGPADKAAGFKAKRPFVKHKKRKSNG